MVNYGLKDKVALITGANNPQGIGAGKSGLDIQENPQAVRPIED